MIGVARNGTAVATTWPALNASELVALASKAQGWFEHAAATGPGAHIQWGQSFPQVIYSDQARATPAKYDDVGDTAAWTGHVLAALAHKFALDGDAHTLDQATAILQWFNFSSGFCTDVVYIPRSTAFPDASANVSGGGLQWKAFSAYFDNAVLPDPTQLVFSCTKPGAETTVWQGDSSRDTYSGFAFGVGSALLAFKGRSAAAAQYSLAQVVFERVSCRSTDLPDLPDYVLWVRRCLISCNQVSLDRQQPTTHASLYLAHALPFRLCPLISTARQ
jgi:hypothetical protein